MEKYVIGLDLGGTNSVFGIVDRSGRIVAQTSVKTWGHEPGVEQYVADCCAALAPLIEQAGRENIVAMGIGAPNANYYTGCIEHAPNLPWKGASVPLASLFSEVLGMPVTMTNDANAAAIGEMCYGAARGMKNFIMITLGTGVGSGVVASGGLVYGSDGMAGELGHMTVVQGGRACGCGRLGCLEAYCSATGVARTAREVLATIDESTELRSLKPEEIESRHVAMAAERGDAVAREIMQLTGQRLGEACANMALFLSPEAFVFFGGLAKAGELIMEPLRRAYDEASMPCFRGKARMLMSQLPDASAAVLGASALAWGPGETA